MTDPWPLRLCQNQASNTGGCFAVDHTQSSNRIESGRHSLDGDLLLPAPTDLNGGRGNGVYCRQRHGLV